jgi:hypothetical protein
MENTVIVPCIYGHPVIANLGDASPIDHGGFFVIKTESGFEVEVLDPPCDDSPWTIWTVWRFRPDQCFWNGTVLSDNESHRDYPAWFAKDLPAIASYDGCEQNELIDWLCSDDPVARATGYRAIGSYWGYINFDGDPLKLNREEVGDRYSHWD